MAQGNVKHVTPEVVANRKTLPYYSQKHADWIKPVVLRMIEDKRSTDFRPDLFGKDIVTLKLMIGRGINFMVDNNDTPDKKWLSFKLATKLTVAKDKSCVTLKYRVQPITPTNMDMLVAKETSTGISTTLVTSPDGDVGMTSGNFQEAIEKFINNDKLPAGQELIIKGVTLDHEGMMSVRAMVAGLDEIEVVKVTEKEIILRKKEVV